VWFETTVTGLRPPSDHGGLWEVQLRDAPSLEASAVVLATGGLSVPTTGSDGIGLDIARGFSLVMHETYPALTPLVADPPVHAHLAGISLDVTIRAPGARPRFATSGGFLFTHRGYSGPSVLDASHLAVRTRMGESRQSLTVQWASWNAETWDRSMIDSRGNVGNLIARVLPLRLADQLLKEAGIPKDLSLAHLQRPARRKIVSLLSEYALPWTGDEGYPKAEVTGGGVSLAEIDPVTMESRRTRGLFLCGEMLDAFGPIGGHNFLWAWVTGRAAGIGASNHP
jgi:predicted Rossmann fold flavoprotein